ncbi:hypothetical protein U9M48_027084 [Paspalum notatum var. saurae]|uniref:RNA helicase n=1 Tax=Paspalum notatum var. saurae TaxID=547442 RepID=A0AAQ3WZ05_PASNO
MSAYANGGGAWSPVPVRSRSPRLGGGGGSGPPGVRELAEEVERLEIDGDGDRQRLLHEYDIEVEVSGEGAPAPVDGFEAAGLAPAVLRNVARRGYESPTPLQRYAIPIVVAGRDLVACAQEQTGREKTAAFCIPVVSGLVAAAAAGGGSGCWRRDGRSLFDRPGPVTPRALVLAPTRELANQIYEEANNFSFQTELRVVVAYGGIRMHDQLHDLKSGVDLLVATPGRLVDMVEGSWVSLEAIKYLVMDEVDRMLHMGFEPHIRRIVDSMPKESVRQTLLFSATLPPKIQSLASEFLYKHISITVERIGSSTGLVEHKVEFVNDGEKRGFLLDLFQEQSVGVANSKKPLTLIFVETKQEANSLQNWLCSKGFSATVIHGDRKQQERESALRSFRSGTTPIMVATNVASSGLDVPNVAHVINYDLPKSMEDYVHRVGRTRRGGEAGTATAFFAESNHPLAKGLVELMTNANMSVPEWLLEYAARPCYGGSHNGARGQRGSGGFGGRNYRRHSDNGYGGGCYGYGSGGGGGGGYFGRGGEFGGGSCSL